MTSLQKLKNEILRPVSFYMKEFDKNFSMTRHVHPYIEVMYCQTGQFKFEVYEERGRGEMEFCTYIIYAGDIVVIDSMVPHCIVTDFEAPSMIHNVEFEAVRKEDYNPYGVYDALASDTAKIIEKSGWKEIAESKNGFTILPDTENVEYCFRSYLNALTGGVDCFEDACAVFARQMMFIAAVGKCKAADKIKGYVLYIKRAKEYIAKNYAANICLEDVARHAGVNKIYLQKLFREYTGQTILQSINAVRVGKARQLLAETNLPIDQILLQTGFRNRQHFIYAFKNIAGQTPSEYRKQNQHQYVNYQVNDLDSKPFVEKNRTEIEVRC